MKEHDIKLVKGMLAFAYKIERRIEGLSLQQFMADDDIQEAILYAVGQMGEKANKLSDAFKEKYPRAEWYGLVGLRNRVFHTYEDISMEIIYHTVTDQITHLIRILMEIEDEL